MLYAELMRRVKAPCQTPRFSPQVWEHWAMSAILSHRQPQTVASFNREDGIPTSERISRNFVPKIYIQEADDLRSRRTFGEGE